LPTDGNAIVFAVWKFQHIKNVNKNNLKRGLRKELKL